LKKVSEKSDKEMDASDRQEGHDARDWSFVGWCCDGGF
jgi:hypothetical protein